ncbi:MAG: hypothetical protein ACPIOQ_38150, partial [Promethearchaeia archaeon]
QPGEPNSRRAAIFVTVSLTLDLSLGAPQVIQNATGKALDQQQPRAAAASADQARDGLQSGSNHAQKCQALRLLAGNDLCADCGTRSPEWASVSLGVLICLQCRSSPSQCARACLHCCDSPAVCRPPSISDC